MADDDGGDEIEQSENKTPRRTTAGVGKKNTKSKEDDDVSGVYVINVSTNYACSQRYTKYLVI